MDKVKALIVTDLKKGKAEDYTSRQIDILQEVTAIDEDIVMDHYGSTFAVDIAQVLDDKIIEEAVNAGAEEVQMYRTAFREEIADDITERADGEWVGYPEYDLAYFTERSDAKLCEELLEEFE